MTLQDLGLDADLERLYRLVIALQACSVERLAGAIGWDGPRVAAEVDRLSGLGLVRLREDEVVVVDPAAAVGSLIERLEDELLVRYRRVSSMRSELADLVSSHAAARSQGPDPSANVERITDRTEIRDRIEELSFFTRSSLSTMQPGGPPSPALIEASRPLDDRGLRRGISMRIIRQPAVLSTQPSRAYLADMVARGAQVRIADVELHRMLIMDEKIAIVPTDELGDVRGALIIRQPVLVAGFCDLFERTWAQAVDLADVESDGTTEPEVSEQDRALLRILTAGVTDEVAARELSISVRHLRRHISRLMTDLDASSRFAAGVEAERRGWL